jgi:hypothetical protein
MAVPKMEPEHSSKRVSGAIVGGDFELTTLYTSGRASSLPIISTTFHASSSTWISALLSRQSIQN